MRLAIVVAGGLVVGSVVLFELTMHPTASDRLRLLGVVVVAALLGLLLRWMLGRLGRRVTSLPLLLGVPAVGALVVVTVAVTLAAAGMVLDTPQLPVVFVAIGLGAGLGVLSTAAVAGRAVEDLERVVDVATGVGAGDLEARTGVTRSDEIGRLAAAVDDMAGRLAADEAARREFLAAVGHDLRTPLAAIGAATEALIDGVADDPDQYLAAIAAHTATLERLVDDVQTLTAYEAGGVSRVPTDLGEVLDESVEAMSPLAARAGVELRLAAAGDLTIPADAHAIGRLIRNLVQNGLDRAPDVGVVEVVARREPGTVSVVVADDGPGFPPELAGTAFDRFVTGDPARARSGFGLGLAIARSVTVAHGGSISIGEGPGGRVEVVIPVDPAAPVPT